MFDRAWKLQHKLEDLGQRFLKKNPPDFLAALFAFSLLCYAMAVWLYFTLIDPINIFTTRKIPMGLILNPVQMISFAFFIFLVLFLKKKNIID